MVQAHARDKRCGSEEGEMIGCARSLKQQKGREGVEMVEEAILIDAEAAVQPRLQQ